MYGPRSSKKLVSIHKYFSHKILEIYGQNYTVHCLPNEKVINGAFCPKKVDIAVENNKTKKIELCVGIKVPFTNFKQNNNNYFERIMGETANTQKTGIPYAQVMILPKTPRYLAKRGSYSEGARIIKEEKLTPGDFLKYKKLSVSNGIYNPAAMTIGLFEIPPSNPSNIKFEEILPMSSFLEKIASLR